MIMRIDDSLRQVGERLFTTLTQAILQGKHGSLQAAAEFLIHMSLLGKA